MVRLSNTLAAAAARARRGPRRRRPANDRVPGPHEGRDGRARRVEVQAREGMDLPEAIRRHQRKARVELHK